MIEREIFISAHVHFEWHATLLARSTTALLQAATPSASVSRRPAEVDRLDVRQQDPVASSIRDLRIKFCTVLLCRLALLRVIPRVGPLVDAPHTCSGRESEREGEGGTEGGGEGGTCRRRRPLRRGPLAAPASVEYVARSGSSCAPRSTAAGQIRSGDAGVARARSRGCQRRGG